MGYALKKALDLFNSHFERVLSFFPGNCVFKVKKNPQPVFG